MLDGVNDQDQHAHQLGKLLEKLKSVRYNFYVVKELTTSYLLTYSYAMPDNLHCTYIPDENSLSSLLGNKSIL